MPLQFSFFLSTWWTLSYITPSQNVLSLDASKSYFVSSLFLISLYLVSHQTLPWFPSCLHLFLLVPFAILVIVSKLDYLKVINTFYLAFLFLYFHFQAILHTVSKLILKALMSSCPSLNKNCSVFTLHPISGCSIAPTLSSVFFFPTASQHIASPQTELVVSSCLPTLMTFSSVVTLTSNVVFFLFLSPFLFSFYPSSKTHLKSYLSEARPFFPIPPIMFVSPIHLIEQHLRWC